MKRLTMNLIVATVAVASAAEPAMAGRRARRRAAVVTGVAAGAAAGAAVTASRRTTVVAAAPVVVAGGVTRTSTYVAALPDLTVSDVSVQDDVHCVTVKNIGRAASPESTVRAEFLAVADGELVAATTIRVPPLAVNQSVRFRLHALPVGRLQENAVVDPEKRIAEIDENNNSLTIEAEFLPPVVAATSLPDVDVDVAPGAEDRQALPAVDVD